MTYLAYMYNLPIVGVKYCSWNINLYMQHETEIKIRWHMHEYALSIINVWTLTKVSLCSMVLDKLT
jgi:hypothetical protein